MALYAQDWVGPFQSPSEEPFDDLFSREYPRVVGIAFRVLQDRAAAEDVAQDVFISFHRKYDAGAPFASAWLHKASSHLALNRVRDSARRRRREEGSAGRTSENRLGVASDASNPESAAARREQNREVREVLARLPKRSAAVLVLRYSGLSYAEVAAALGCRTTHVGTLLKRAEDKFRKEYLNAART